MKNIENFFDTRTKLRKFIDNVYFSTNKWIFIINEVFRKIYRRIIWW
jgi:hypothetical protein